MEVRKEIFGSQFLGSLFDFSFSEFVTIKIIRGLYGLGIIGSALFAVFLVFGSFSKSVLIGIISLVIIGPIVFLIGVLLCRIYLEILIVIFRISEDVREIVQLKKQ